MLPQVPVVASRPCKENEMGLPFEIRGTQLRVEDGYLQGSGKLVILPKWPDDRDENEKVRWIS